jgi:phosphate transport system substrate-binding protein
MTARQMVVLVVVVLAVPVGYGSVPVHAGTPSKNVPAGTMHIHGAGATFPAPLYKKWIEEYQKRRPEVMVSYDAVGSGEGVKEFMAGRVEFGASDAAMSDAQIAEVGPGVNWCRLWPAALC